LDNVQLGSIIALAIAIHNIPEGISVAVPIYCATRSRKKAFYYSLLAGIAEPIGAVIGLLVLMPIISPAVIGALLAFVAGIMVYISVDELLPMSQRCGHNHASVIGLVLGMAVMALSLMVL
jgi:ZIP family zinc transporter